ncbi:MAG: 8-oxoguanine deaminase [Chloroflexota bacterium]
MTSTLLSSCRVIATMNDARTELAGASISIQDGWITYVGSDPPAEPRDEEIDCRNFAVIPGLVNTHHHLYQTLTRAFPESEGQTLFPWLRMLYPIWAGLDTEMIYASTCAGLAELALSGCTTCADHLYVFPPGSDDFIDAQIEAARSIGMRFHPTRGSMDLGQSQGGLPPDSVIQPIDTILADSERLTNRYHDSGRGSLLRIGIAPCSPFSVSRELMSASAQLARRHGIRLHTHIAETMDEDAYSRQHFGVSPVRLLHDLDWLGHDVWLAHCVHPGDDDIALMASAHAGVAHCPTSNMLLGSGLAPVARFLSEGIEVGIGVDGSSSNDGNDLSAEVKQTILAARTRDGADALTVREALWCATRGGAACLGREDTGSIEPGKAADLVLFDAGSLECAGGQEDLLAAIVLGSPDPHTVLIHGRTIVRGGNLLSADVHQIAAQQNAQAVRLMAKARSKR